MGFISVNLGLPEIEAARQFYAAVHENTDFVMNTPPNVDALPGVGRTAGVVADEGVDAGVDAWLDTQARTADAIAGADARNQYAENEFKYAVAREAWNPGLPPELHANWPTGAGGELLPPSEWPPGNLKCTDWAMDWTVKCRPAFDDADRAWKAMYPESEWLTP